MLPPILVHPTPNKIGRSPTPPCFPISSMMEKICRENWSASSTDFRPTLIVTPHPQDQHPDHCATYFFVRAALHAYGDQHPALHPVFLRFLIHFGQWPQDTKTSVSYEPHLMPPLPFPEGQISWLSLPLTASEIDGKRRVLTQYKSQMLVMGSYLLSFVRANELFSPAPHTDVEENEKLRCCGQTRGQLHQPERSSPSGSEHLSGFPR